MIRSSWLTKLAGLATGLAACAGVGHAEIRLPRMLSAHAVLQRDRPLHIWGWSDPGECVQIAFHSQTAQTCANELGQWSTLLKPESAGGPFVLTVTSTASSSEKLVLDDLLVGDVWLASGQSNMEMPLKGFGPTTPIKDSEKEIAASAHPKIRLLRFNTRASAFPMDDVATTWTECTPQTAADFSAAAYFFGRELQEKEHVPIGLIDSTWGGTPIESWISLDAIGADPSLMPLFLSRARFVANRAEIPALIAAEKREDEAAAQAGKPKPRHSWHPGDDSSFNPSYLYNGMIAPAVPYTLRGFLWYQGETNSDPERAPLYAREMRTLILNWREKWGEGDLPFLLVQLSSFDSPREDWGQIREAQRQALALVNTAMAVSYDVGTPGNVHPPDKETVGHRLALGARALSYGEKVEWTGPLLRAAGRAGSEVRLSFDHAEGLHAEGSVKGFEVAGSDGVYAPANARIEGTEVVLEGAGASTPAAVRYGYANVTPANLRNSAGLPAPAFATKF